MSDSNSVLWSKTKKNNLGLEKWELNDKSLVKDIEQLITYKGSFDHKTGDTKFITKNDTVSDESLHSKSLHLSAVDIEGGGPQPRTQITPDDPETVKLFHNLHERYKLYGNIEKTQLVPIQVYRSPTTPGKYRVFDGHRRTMVIFTMLMLPEIKANCLT